MYQSVSLRGAMLALMAATSLTVTACAIFDEPPPRYNSVVGEGRRAPLLNPQGAGIESLGDNYSMTSSITPNQVKTYPGGAAQQAQQEEAAKQAAVKAQTAADAAMFAPVPPDAAFPPSVPSPTEATPAPADAAPQSDNQVRWINGEPVIDPAMTQSTSGRKLPVENQTEIGVAHQVAPPMPVEEKPLTMEMPAVSEAPLMELPEPMPQEQAEQTPVMQEPVEMPAEQAQTSAFELESARALPPEQVAEEQVADPIAMQDAMFAAPEPQAAPPAGQYPELAEIPAEPAGTREQSQLEKELFEALAAEGQQKYERGQQEQAAIAPAEFTPPPPPQEMVDVPPPAEATPEVVYEQAYTPEPQVPLAEDAYVAVEIEAPMEGMPPLAEQPAPQAYAYTPEPQAYTPPAATYDYAPPPAPESYAAAPPPAFSASAEPVAIAEPYETVYEDTTGIQEDAGLEPIRLRAPGSAAAGAAAAAPGHARAGGLLPESRYAARDRARRATFTASR